MVAKGTTASISSPFGFGFSLVHGGVADFGSNKWKISATPAFSGFSFDIGELFKAENFVTLRAIEGEIGVSFDKEGINHFFTFVNPISTSKFSLKFKVGTVVQSVILMRCM